MGTRTGFAAVATIGFLSWSEPSFAQLHFSVDSRDQCPGAAQRIVEKVYYYKKLKVDQRFYNRIKGEVSRNAVYNQSIRDLDIWAKREVSILTSQCRGSFPTPQRPWTYEYRE